MRSPPGDVPRLSARTRAALDALTPAEIERNAETDLDNPPITEEQARRGLFGRRVRLLRQGLGLSQSQFAARYRIDLTRLAEWEQGGEDVDTLVETYISLIEADPDSIADLLARSTRPDHP